MRTSFLMDNNYQFIIDEIPDAHIKEFIHIMSSFTKRTHCRFSYKEGKGIKHHLIPISEMPKN
mgnify:CR=1 FL=1